MKKKLNRVLTIVMAIAAVFGMTACGHEHEWAQASCLSPKTCISCSETEGDALGHTWVDATCDVAKTCSVCGETEGEALGHTWVDANYQAPKTCSVCASTEGEPLVSYFAEYGLDARLLDKSGEYDLAMPCGTDATKTTVAKVTVEDYKTIASDETHEAMDGYEWKIMTINMRFSDENANRYGGSLGMWLHTNKYTARTVAADEDSTGLNEDGKAHLFEWYGVAYNDGLINIDLHQGDWIKKEDGTFYIDFTYTVSIRVPVGYDGFVFGLETTGWDWPEGKYLHEVITDGTLLFNFD